MARKKQETHKIEELGEFSRNRARYRDGTHIQVKETLYLYGPVESVIAQLTESAAGLIDPVIDEECDYDGTYRFFLLGWREMNPAEQKLYERLKQAEQTKQRALKEQQNVTELKEYERLKKKYGDG